MNTNTRSTYGPLANIYDAILTYTGFKRALERFFDRIPLQDLPPRPRMLDAGCGTGLVARYLARRFPNSEIVAFDIDREMLAAMQRELASEGLGHDQLIVAQGDLLAPDRLRLIASQEPVSVPKGYFDAIFVSGALEHVPLADALPKLARLLKPGGTLLNISVKRNPAGAVLGMVYRFRPYRVAELRRAFADAGLQEIRTLRLSVEDFPANLSRVAVIARKRYL